jgi:spore maturation protein SpmA
VPTMVIPSAVVAVAVVPATVVTVAPIGSEAPIIAITVAVIRSTVIVWTGSIISRSVKNRHRNWQAKSKTNTSARRRFREERQSRHNQQEDNELLHI